MKKTSVLWTVLGLVFLAVFNALFFTVGMAGRNASVWISYGFINFAYLMLLLTPLLIRSGKSSAVFGFSLYSVSAAYFFVEFAAGITFISVAPANHAAALLVQACLAGLYAVLLLSHMVANERTAEAEEERQPQIDYVKSAAAKLKALSDGVSDKEAKKAVERAYDAIYSSPVKSHPNAAAAENNILKSIDALAGAVKAGNKEYIISLANTLSASINERNSILKTSQ